MTRSWPSKRPQGLGARVLARRDLVGGADHMSGAAPMGGGGDPMRCAGPMGSVDSPSSGPCRCEATPCRCRTTFLGDADDTFRPDSAKCSRDFGRIWSKHGERLARSGWNLPIGHSGRIRPKSGQGRLLLEFTHRPRDPNIWLPLISKPCRTPAGLVFVQIRAGTPHILRSRRRFHHKVGFAQSCPPELTASVNRQS